MSGGMDPRTQHDGTRTYDVFVGNLPGQADEAALRVKFEEYGIVHSVILKPGKPGFQNSMFAFVRFLSEDDAEKAIKVGNGTEFCGTSLVVKSSKRRSNPGPSFGAGGDAGGYGNKPDLVSTAHKTNVRGGYKHRDYGQSGQQYKAPQDFTGEEFIIVTHIDGPCLFWGQNCEERSIQEMSKISESLESICPSTAFSGVVQMNKIYATKYVEDNNWYRCKPVHTKSDTETEVLYIDYGNKDVVQNAAFVDIPPSLANYKPQARRYCLYGLRPAFQDPASLGFEQGVSKLRELTDNRKLKAKFYISEKGPKGLTPVIMEYDSVDVNQEMLNAGFGEKRFHSGGKTSESGGGGKDKSPSSKQGRRQQYPGLNDAPHNRNFDKPPISNSNFGNAPSSTMYQQGDSKDIGLSKMSNIDIAKLQHELRMTQLELVKLKSEMKAHESTTLNHMGHYQAERDEAVVELATLRGQYRSIERDHKDLSTKIKEAALSYKLKKLLAGVDKVKFLRSQFPTDSQIRDDINWAMGVVGDQGCQIRTDQLESVKDVREALNLYNAAQDALCQCSDTSPLESLIKERDSKREVLYVKLEQFLKNVSDLPLETRIIQLKQCRIILESKYAGFLASGIDGQFKLEEAMARYADWKFRKISEFQDARTVTNTCHNAVNSALELVQQQLSLEPTSRHGESCAVPNLDTLLGKLEASVGKEIEHTDVEHSQDTALISTILKSLVNNMKSELNDIEHISQLKADWAELNQMISSWLSEKPDVSNVKTTRANIRNLKSKIRHKLADIQDLEEDSEGSGCEAQTLQKDLADLRKQLHVAFSEEDKFLADLWNLTSYHFPELPLQYPEFGLKHFRIHKGLVKQGRTIDHYGTVSLPGTDKKSILMGTYNDTPVVLKEFIIDDSLGLTKDNFIERTVVYHMVQGTNLVPLEAVFFVKNDRQVYVQTPMYEESVATLVDRDPPEEDVVHKILSGLLKGLLALHKMNLVHGAIHPNNVFVDKDGNGILGDYDFSKQPNQRPERCYRSSTGLKFVAPELGSSSGRQITLASDMYNVGLLALWIQFPNVVFHCRANDVPDIGSLGNCKPLMRIVSNLLDSEPSNRLTVTQMPSFSSFCQPHSLGSSDITSDKETTLQLRHKQPSTTSSSKLNGGILKNGSSSSTIVESSCIVSCSTGDADIGSHDISDEIPELEECSFEQDDDVRVESNEMNIACVGEGIACVGEGIACVGEGIDCGGEDIDCVGEDIDCAELQIAEISSSTTADRNIPDITTQCDLANDGQGHSSTDDERSTLSTVDQDHSESVESNSAIVREANSDSKGKTYPPDLVLAAPETSISNESCCGGTNEFLSFPTINIQPPTPVLSPSPCSESVKYFPEIQDSSPQDAVVPAQSDQVNEQVTSSEGDNTSTMEGVASPSKTTETFNEASGLPSSLDNQPTPTIQLEDTTKEYNSPMGRLLKSLEAISASQSQKNQDGEDDVEHAQNGGESPSLCSDTAVPPNAPTSTPEYTAPASPVAAPQTSG